MYLLYHNLFGLSTVNIDDKSMIIFYYLSLYRRKKTPVFLLGFSKLNTYTQMAVSGKYRVYYNIFWRLYYNNIYTAKAFSNAVSVMSILVFSLISLATLYFFINASNSSTKSPTDSISTVKLSLVLISISS